MAAKKKITINRKPKKVEKVEEVKVEEVIEEVEKPVETVVEEEINPGQVVGMTKSATKAYGTIWGTTVVKPKGRIVFEAQAAPYPMFKLPQDIQKYLISHGLTTEVYKKDKEWLEKHNVNMEIVQRLKEFITEVL